MSLSAGITNYAVRYDRVETTSSTDPAILDFAATNADLLIVQPGQNNNPGTDVLLTLAQIGAIKSGDVDMVAAYMSIGKMEAGRDFSAGLGAFQFTSGGVEYLNVGAQQVVDALADHAATLGAQGFDALFLDDVLAYFFAVGPVFADVKSAARAMMDLVISINAAADAAADRDIRIIMNGDPFLIGNLLFGNGESEPDDAATIATFLDSIDALMLESAYSNLPNLTSKDAQLAAVNATYRAPGNTDPTTLLALDYLSNLPGATIEAKAFPFYRIAADDNVIPLAAPLTLDANDRPFDRATSGRDVLDASRGAADRSGGGGDDYLLGDGRVNTFEGGAGGDVLNGGGAFDFASYANATAAVRANLGNSVTNTGEAAGDSYVAIEGLIGSAFNDTLIGNGGANTINGGLGNDAINGAGGVDTLNGGAGVDTLIGGAGGDVLNGGADFDFASYAGATTNIRAQLNTSVNNTGDALGDTYANMEGLIGGAFNDILIGAAGNNVIRGGLGNDTINGLEGQDNLFGQGGNDRFQFSAPSHTAAGSRRDIIGDFEDFSDNDTIDISAFAGVYSFIGGAAFTALNQVRAVQSGASVQVQINTQGSLVADAEILLVNTALAQVDATDFIL